MQNNNLDVLQTKINYKFKNTDILKKALIHPSYANEHNIEKYNNNQRIEFLGDAVLELIVSSYIYEKYETLTEGELTKLRSKMVCEENLSHVARTLNLYEYLYLGKSETVEKMKNNNGILCDTVECIIGAIYLDSNISFAKKFIEDYIIGVFKDDVFNDYKTMLYEYCNKYHKNILYKEISSCGPDHKKLFKMGLLIDNKLITTSKGYSKKQAEQAAAKEAIKILKIGE